MSQLLAPRFGWVGALVVSAGLLHCGGGGDEASPTLNAAGSGAGAPAEPEPEPEPEIPTLNGCKSADYVDLSAGNDERIILIAAAGLTYSPKCMIVSATQAVTWQGSLSAHPLAPGNPADAEAGSPDNPIPTVTSGSNVEVTFPVAGTYPYHCQLHSFGSGQGMAGAVHVRAGP